MTDVKPLHLGCHACNPAYRALHHTILRNSGPLKIAHYHFNVVPKIANKTCAQSCGCTSKEDALTFVLHDKAAKLAFLLLIAM